MSVSITIELLNVVVLLALCLVMGIVNVKYIILGLGLALEENRIGVKRLAYALITIGLVGLVLLFIAAYDLLSKPLA